MDETQQVEPFLKQLLELLDGSSEQFQLAEAFSGSFAASLKPNSSIIINGNPIGSKQVFQAQWSRTPLSLHQITNFDAHVVPGTGIIAINATGKVKFDESGKSRLEPKKALWSSWFGFSLHVVAEAGFAVANLDYRVTYRPGSVVIM